MKIAQCLFAILLVLSINKLSWAAEFGVEGGRGVRNARQALEQVYGDTPPDLEIILSYAMFTKNITSMEDVNPFGHIALGIMTTEGYRIITVNQKAVSGEETLFFKLTPEDYFYRTEPMPGAIHGSHIGLAYARSSVAIQLRGIDPAALASIRTKIAEIDQQHKSGQVKFCVTTKNCAHLTTELLNESGIVETNKPNKFPAEVFDQALAYGVQQSGTNVGTSVVFYRKLLSDHRYQYENIPAPGYKFFATLMNMLGYNSLHRVTGPATVVGTSNEQDLLKVEQSERSSAVADSCSRIWIAPFVLAILRRK